MRLRFTAAAAVVGLFPVCATAAPSLVATYNFNNTLAADEIGAPALTAIDPLGQNGFITDTVFGETRTVYRFDGSSSPIGNQAGLELDTTGLLDGDDTYSVEIVFQFEADNGSWKSIFGVSNRTSDNAFYVQPGNTLQIYPDGNGSTIFGFGVYHDVILTNRGDGTVTGYMDGVYEFDLTSTVMDFSTYAVDNPSRLIHFFVDNFFGGGFYEYTDGRVALIRVYDNELTPEEVDDIGSDPLGEGVPAPGAIALLGLGLLGLARMRRRA